MPSVMVPRRPDGASTDLRRAALRRRVSLALLFAAMLAPAHSARALPADVLLVVDTSRSMADDAGGETKLQLAKSIAAQVAGAAGERHHVGLIRFAQLGRIVNGGEGSATLHAEDPKACVRMADLLVPLSSTGAAEATVWLDGVEAPGEPELAAVGDSPLLGTLDLAFAYLRARRVEDPLHACVNTYVVVLTDGEDTCAGAGDVTSGLAGLAATADEEAIRVLVLSFDPEGETSKLLATIGAEGAPGAPFLPDQADQLVALIAAIEGHPTPEGCIASGVPASTFGGALDADAVDGAAASAEAEPGVAGDGGCGAGHGSSSSLLAVLGLALAFVSRRRVTLALLLALLTGCSDDAAPGGWAAATSTDAATAPDATLPDPEAEAAADLTRIEAVAAEAATLRTDVLAPVLDPATAFAAIAGEPVAGCLALTRSVGLEAYEGAQRGPAGCLATRRCNPIDKALLLQACLGSYGVEAELSTCWHDEELDAALSEALSQPVALPDVAPMEAAVEAAIDAVTTGDPELGQAARLLGPAAKEGTDRELSDAIDADMALLQPFVDALDPDVSAGHAAQARAEALTSYAFLVSAGQVLDPTFASSSAGGATCAPAPLDPETVKALVTLRLLVQYAEPASLGNGTALTLLTETVAGEMTYAPADHWGETVTVAITGAGATAIEPGLPDPATSGCMRPLFQIDEAAPTLGQPFFIGNGETCAAPPVVPGANGRHLASVTLEAEVTLPGRSPRTFRRTLTNRYGYVTSLVGLVSGPMYSAESARSLLAMRIDLPVVAGLPTEQALADVLLANIVAQRDASLAAAREAWGLPAPTAPPGPPLPIAWATLGRFANHLPALLDSGAVASFERPWLLALVQRRGFGVSEEEGLELEGQLIFDVLDAPIRIDAPGGDAVARLDAQARAGVLLTESERLAVAGFASTPLVVNAGLMLRDPGTGTWDVWGTAGHEPNLFPYSVSWDVSGTTETLVVTPGPAPFLDGEYAAWWRLDPATGWLLGEVRLDGTFYGGAAAGGGFGKVGKQGVKVIADVDRCLWCTAALALEGVEFDNEKCLADAVSGNATDLAFKLGSKAAFGVTICNFAGLSEGLGKYAVDMAFENLPGLSAAKDLYDILKWAKKYKTPCDAYIK